MAKKKILILYTQVGGGHKSVSEVMRAQLEKDYGEQVQIEMIDMFRGEYSSKGMHLWPEIYPKMGRVPDIYNFIYRLSNGETRNKLINGISWLYSRDQIEQMLADHKPDLILSAISFVNTPFLNTLELMEHPPKFAIIVTDWGIVHNAWYDVRADVIFAPTQEVRHNAMANHVKSSKIEVLGYPTKAAFGPTKAAEKAKLRAKLGWDKAGFNVLLLGGLEGMGNIAQIAKRIARYNPDIHLAVVTGKNEKLQAKLIEQNLGSNVKIYGYVQNMAEMMGAADVLVSKGGGATLGEALNSHLPIIFFDYLLEQERGNSEYVISAGGAIWAHNSAEISHVLRYWQSNREAYQKAKKACAKLARPNAARDIARTLHNMPQD